MGHVRIHGLDISIENPRGSYRSGKGPDGKTWRARLPAHYGYFKRTEGADGDHLDAFIGPHHKSPLVYVIDQNDLKSGKFDEHKAFIGFNSAKQVRNAYHDAFSDGRGKDRIGHLEEMTVDQFKDWLRDGDTKFPVKHRAEGGRVGMADGGTPPAFDPSQPFEPVKALAFDPSAPFEAVPDAANAEPADHGLSERQKLSPVGKALSPITGYWPTYEHMNREAQEQVARGAGQVGNGPWETTKGIGNIAAGTLGYVGSPISAAYRS